MRFDRYGLPVSAAWRTPTVEDGDEAHPLVVSVVEHETETRPGTHPGRAYKPG